MREEIAAREVVMANMQKEYEAMLAERAAREQEEAEVPELVRHLHHWNLVGGLLTNMFRRGGRLSRCAGLRIWMRSWRRRKL
jgi:hypothetical protein